MQSLSQRQLLLALLDRQLLLRRARLSVRKGLERVGGLQAQYAPSMYVGLWTRLDGFQRSTLDSALAARTVVQGTLLRSTIHLVSVDDYWFFANAIRSTRKAWWLRSRKDADAADLDNALFYLRARMRDAGGQMKAKDIEQAIGMKVEAMNQWTELVRVPPSGTWEHRRADLYALAEDWIPRRSTLADPVKHLVRSYLGGFGPATVADIASWAGVQPRHLAPAVEGMQLRSFRSENGEELVDLPRARIPDPADTEVPVRFLPVWDANLLVHARRTGILPEEHRPTLFSTKNPQSFNTFLVDGRVAGTWKHGPKGIEVSPFGRLPKPVRSQLEEEAEGLDALHR